MRRLCLNTVKSFLQACTRNGFSYFPFSFVPPYNPQNQQIFMSIRQLAQKIQNIQTPVGWRCDLSVKHFVEYIRMTCFLLLLLLLLLLLVLFRRRYSLEKNAFIQMYAKSIHSELLEFMYKNQYFSVIMSLLGF